MRKEYGEQCAQYWLEIQINDYQNYVSTKGEDELKDEVVSDMARLVLNEFGYLRMTDIMLFLMWLKTGKYGEVYGRINPQNFFCNLRRYLRERSAILDRYENEQNTKRLIEARKKAISYEDYKKKHAKE